MSVRRLSKSYISGGGDAGPRSSSFLASYSPAIDEMYLIQRVTVGAGGAASIDFTSIPQIYQHLQIRVVGRVTAAGIGDYAKTTFNQDTASNYSHHNLYGTGANALVLATTSTTSIINYRLYANDALANTFGVFILDILDYTSTSKNKTTRSFGGADQNSNNEQGQVWLNSGLWMSTAAINSIKFVPSSSNFAQYSTFSLYGVIA